MKKYLDSMTRSKSTDSKSHNNSVSSILKDPSRCKLKHNRSVRFLEPPDLSSDESFQEALKNQEKSKNADEKPSAHDNFVKDLSRPGSQGTNLAALPPKSVSTTSKANYVKNSNQGKKAIKEGKGKQQSKLMNFSVSPKFEPKVMNFQFRDKGFYEKLNRFITTKSSVSPERVVEEEGVDVVKRAQGHCPSKSYDVAGEKFGSPTLKQHHLYYKQLGGNSSKITQKIFTVGSQRTPKQPALLLN